MIFVRFEVDDDSNVYTFRILTLSNSVHMFLLYCESLIKSKISTTASAIHVPNYRQL